MMDTAEDRNKQAAQWQQIVNLSHQMLTCAQQSNWEQLDSLHTERDGLLDDFFRQALAEDLVESVQQGIAQIRNKDEQIVELISKNKTALADQVRSLQQQKKRVENYLAGSSDSDSITRS